MKLDMEIGLGPDHFVLDGDPARPKRGTASPLFGPCLLWPNSWMDQDATWYVGRPRPRPHCAMHIRTACENRGILILLTYFTYLLILTTSGRVAPGLEKSS